MLSGKKKKKKRTEKNGNLIFAILGRVGRKSRRTAKYNERDNNEEKINLIMFSFLRNIIKLN